ncbi:carboxylesterase [Phyllosticta citrichinensis]|uniref:Carboxylic ester hydrolase n=1 Tax=Phyllosticta citrichinensis TaxID=1130410 RepID=A0ABR1XU41_9PEZI
MAALRHGTLNATLFGLVNGSTLHFRGIRYGYVPARFARPFPVDDWHGRELNCTQYGPRCPQVHLDVGHLLRVPEDITFPEEPEDEFECLNLDVCVPAGASGPMPVMIWIHGGSQVVTFGSAASGICDPIHIVQDSARLGKPIIFVSVQYRLNIFGFGDGTGSRNLPLKDQRLAIEWVRKHIGGFGGDPSNLTLAGESGGAVYVHAHVVTDAPVKRAILQSGSLGMSPPQPPSRGDAILASLGGSALRGAAVKEIVGDLAVLEVNALWLQLDDELPQLKDWAGRTGNVEAFLIGDNEYESVLWRNGVEEMTAGMILSAFNLAGHGSRDLGRMYGISANRPTASKTGALDFCGDVRYSFPIRKLSELWLSAGRKVYSYVFDQANPWQASSRAHHGVELLMQFNGLDLSFNAAAEAVGAEMRRRWIAFVRGEEPWAGERTFEFGPHGECRELDAGGYRQRRRVGHMELMEGMDWTKVTAACSAIAAGRVSLLN